VGSYLWAKEAADQAAELEVRMMDLAVLTNTPLEAVQEQVATLAKAGRTSSMAVISQLEYSHHYRQIQKLELPPAKASDRGTVTLHGKPYHWAAALGSQLRLVPGESPW
jgi:hypothetical protein